MDREKIIAKVQEIFKDILDEEEIELKDNTTANDVDNWDSLTHILLVVAIEKAFKIKFTSKEILLWKNVGEMIDSIQAK
ncbi:acyl carrier protein [uncultured Bacteroides sp.]|uniref:acyl carrier protein n=1 Tax=uncultured Bacteroides sp. TaxID=162156 RepID=UPI002AAB78FB|nr:acyl carrier protein [uncultured Bacteroides sp.]